MPQKFQIRHVMSCFIVLLHSSKLFRPIIWLFEDTFNRMNMLYITTEVKFISKIYWCNILITFFLFSFSFKWNNPNSKGLLLIYFLVWKMSRNWAHFCIGHSFLLLTKVPLIFSIYEVRSDFILALLSLIWSMLSNFYKLKNINIYLYTNYIFILYFMSKK